MNFILRFLTLLLNLLNLIVAPIFWLRSRGKIQKVSAISEKLLTISATDLAEKIRKREVSSEHICIIYIKRIKEVNHLLNAIVEERFESAIQDARNIDAFLKTSLVSSEELKKTKPLLGVPLTVKESCSVAGLSLSGATLARAGIKAHKDGDVVAKLKASGAIPLLVSNTPEICLGWESNNYITGKTNNPYDITRTSSGSSGGEGALLGAGASLIGIGSDVAGSIRLPAMFNGVFGHKPTARVVSIKGHYPYVVDDKYANHLSLGPLTRYAKDLKLMMKIITNDSMIADLKLDQPVDLSSIKIFYMEEEGKSFVLPKVQKEIIAAITQSVEYLKVKCSCQIIEDYKFVDLQNSCEIAGSVLYGLKDIPNLLKSENENLALEVIKCFIGLSKYTYNLLIFYTFQHLYTTVVSNDGYLRKNDYLRQLFTEKLGNNGVFLYPTFTTSAFRHDSLLFHSSAISYLMIFNSLGLPATHVPCGLDENGLPIGIQVVAGPYQDRLCFAVAEELEKYFGGWIPPS